MDKIKLYQIYNPIVDQIYQIALDFSGILGIFIYPFCVYVILTRSSTLDKLYKKMLLYYITFSFGLEFLLSSYKPMTLFPIYIFYPTGWTKIFGKTGVICQDFFTYFILINMLWANYVSIMYRFCQMFGGYKETVFRNQRNFLIYIGVNNIMPVLLIFPTKLSLHGIEAFNLTRLDKDVQEFVLNQTAVVGIDMDANPLGIFQAYVIVGILTMLLITIIFFTSYVIKRLEKKIKVYNSAKTYQTSVSY